MATVNKNFKIKNGLVVEGTTGTINNYDILTKKQDDQDYIVGLIGGTATPNNTPNTIVKRDASGNFAAGTITAALTGNVTGTVSSLSNHDTDDLAEGLNLYFTAERAQDEIGNAVTNGTSFSSGGSLSYVDATNSLYLTVTDQFPSHSTTDLSEGTNKYYTDQRVDDYINTYIDTDDVSEGTTNKYFSNVLARGAVDNGDGLNYDSASGIFSVHYGNGLSVVAGALVIDDSVVATDTDVSNAIDAHNTSSGIHGITGDVVGTTDAQIISNKTLGGDLAAGGFQITGLGIPNNSTDAATKEYVDAVTEGLHIHEAAVAATTENISISADLMVGDMIDGVTLASTNRVLVKNQNTASENGIYVVQPSGAAIRATDFDQPDEIDGGDFIFVTGGIVNDNTGWVQTSTGIVTIGTDPVYFTQFSGAGTYLAGNGLTLDGTTFEINESITATNTYVGTAISTHSNLTTGVHGVTGNVVGTTDTQTLTNKALGASTTLSADLDASSNKIINLEDPTSNQDAATKYYVDTEVSGVAGDLTIHEGATTGIHGVTGNIVGTSDFQILTNKTIDASSNTLSNIANGSLVNDSVTINGQAVALGSSTTLDTDDILEGVTNKYFTDQRAVDALEAIIPNFTEIDINSLVTQVASSVTSFGSVQVTAYQFDKTTIRSGKFLVKIDNGTHNEISEILLTLDASDNIAITEYAIVGTNGSRGTITADVDGIYCRIRVTTVNDSTITIMGTLVA